MKTYIYEPSLFKNRQKARENFSRVHEFPEIHFTNKTDTAVFYCTANIFLGQGTMFDSNELQPREDETPSLDSQPGIGEEYREAMIQESSNQVIPLIFKPNILIIITHYQAMIPSGYLHTFAFQFIARGLFCVDCFSSLATGSSCSAVVSMH